MPSTNRGRARAGALASAAALVTALLIAPAASAVGPAEAEPAASDPAVETSVETTVETYAENTAVIANPARGFYRHTETHSRADGSGWTPLNASTLAGYRSEGVTQILRVVYLERYVDSDLDARLLDAVTADMNTAREAGVSIILRFAYAQGGNWPYSPPYRDATLERVLSHIDQLTPLLRQNADVVAVLQQGFIGLWGEGYYTDHFVADPADPAVVTDADWEKRNAVVEALLEALPVSRSMQARTMFSKQQAFDRSSGVAGALTPSEAFSGSPISRVGHHNDCFLAAPEDFGTFLSDPISLDQEYLGAETRFVPMGGETCMKNPPRSEWPTASSELARYHYSYLNRDYNQEVLNSWGAENLTVVAKRLGYRFVLEESRTVGGAEPSLEIDVRNDGWAAPYNQRPVEVALEGEEGTVTVPLDIDARTWAPGESVTMRVPLDDVPVGSYRAHLVLPAAEASISDDPRFAIQTANVDTWDAARGWNDLRQTVVVGRTPDAVTAPSIGVATAGVNVGWTGSPSGGTSAPSRYVVTLTPESGAPLALEVSAESRAATFRDVPAGRWSATVEARNALGASPTSSPSAVATVTGGQPVRIVASATSQCVNGTVHVAVHALNGAGRPIDVRLTTLGSEKKVSALAPQKGAYVLVDGRASTLAAGRATVTAYTRVDGVGYHSTYTPAYAALACS